MHQVVKSFALGVLLSLVASVFPGCGETLEAPEPVAMQNVPESVMQVAVKTMPGVRFEHAWKITVDGKEAFEMKGKDKRGKTCEVEVSSSGEVIEVE